MKPKNNKNKFVSNISLMGISLAVLLFSFAFLASAVDNQTALQDGLKSYEVKNG